MNQIQQVPAVEPQQRSAVSVRAGFFDLNAFEMMQRVSKAFSSSDLVPQQYRGNLANCMIALDMAQRIGAAPLQVMQNLYVVHGTPGWSSKFLIATINASGKFSSLRYEWRGEPGQPEYGCRAWAVELATGERLDGIWVTWKMVNAEGWASKSGSKWKTMPDQMFVYRAAAFWQRAYAPELAMGLQTVEDLHDTIDVTPVQVAQPARVHVPTPGRRADPMAEQPALAIDEPPPEQVDQQTGEISQPSAASNPVGKPEVPQFDAEAFAQRLEACTDADVLDLVADEIRDVPDADLRATLNDIAERRRGELQAAKQPAPRAQAARVSQRSARTQMSIE